MISKYIHLTWKAENDHDRSVQLCFTVNERDYVADTFENIGSVVVNVLPYFTDEFTGPLIHQVVDSASEIDRDTYNMIMKHVPLLRNNNFERVATINHFQVLGSEYSLTKEALEETIKILLGVYQVDFLFLYAHPLEIGIFEDAGFFNVGDGYMYFQRKLSMQKSGL